MAISIYGGVKIGQPDSNGNRTIALGQIFIFNVASTVTASQFTANPFNPSGSPADINIFYNGTQPLQEGNSILILNTDDVPSLTFPTSINFPITEGTIYLWNGINESSCIAFSQIDYQSPGKKGVSGTNNIGLSSEFSVVQSGNVGQGNASFSYTVTASILLPNDTTLYPSPASLTCSLIEDSDPLGQKHLEFTYNYPYALPTTSPTSSWIQYPLQTYSVADGVLGAKLKKVVVCFKGTNRHVKGVANPVKNDPRDLGQKH